MRGDLLGDFQPAAARQVIRSPRGAESVAAYRGSNARIGGAAADHARTSGRDIGEAESRFVLPTAERNSGALRSSAPARPAGVFVILMTISTTTRNTCTLFSYEKHHPERRRRPD